jgi:gluconolactonase
VRRIAFTGGGPNGLAAGSDDALYVAQSGQAMPGVLARPPGIQRVTASAQVEEVCTTTRGTHPLGAPNDLAFGPDGRLYFTDPAGSYDLARVPVPNRILAVVSGPADVVLDLDDVFVNGVGFDADGRLLWTESSTRRLMRLDGQRLTTIYQFGHGYVPDGFALAQDGRIYVATLTSSAVSVISPTGEYLGEVRVDGWPTNCAFDKAMLYVTVVSTLGDDAAGSLWEVETDGCGMQLRAGATR